MAKDAKSFLQASMHLRIWFARGFRSSLYIGCKWIRGLRLYCVFWWVWVCCEFSQMNGTIRSLILSSVQQCAPSRRQSHWTPSGQGTSLVSFAFHVNILMGPYLMNRQGMKSLLSNGHGVSSRSVRCNRHGHWQATHSAEQALSLILVSLPTLRPLFRNTFALHKSDRSPPKAPTIGRRFHRKAPPDYSLLKRTNHGNSLGAGRKASYAILRDDSANPDFPQIPLAAYHDERPVELNVRAEHVDLENGQWTDRWWGFNSFRWHCFVTRRYQKRSGLRNPDVM